MHQAATTCSKLRMHHHAAQIAQGECIKNAHMEIGLKLLVVAKTSCLLFGIRLLPLAALRC